MLTKVKTAGKATVHYRVVLPNGYDPAKAYPAVLAYGGSLQTMDVVDKLCSYLGDNCTRGRASGQP